MTAGIAANKPSAVANKASAMPGATTASDVFCACAIPVKLRMMPQTVPNRPTKGATAPTVASIFSRSDRRSTSLAMVDDNTVDSRDRVASLSIGVTRVDARHSANPAWNICALGTFDA